MVLPSTEKGVREVGGDRIQPSVLDPPPPSVSVAPLSPWYIFELHPFGSIHGTVESMLTSSLCQPHQQVKHWIRVILKAAFQAFEGDSFWVFIIWWNLVCICCIMGCWCTFYDPREKGEGGCSQNCMECKQVYSKLLLNGECWANWIFKNPRFLVMTLLLCERL